MMERYSLNIEALNDFLKFGIVVPKQNFFSMCEDFSETVNTVKPRYVVNFQPDQENLENSVYSALEESVATIIDSQQCDSMAISGGADSRLILSILKKNHNQFLKNARVYTRVHPLLGTKRDRDFLIVEKLSQRFDFKFDTEQIHHGFSQYLVPLKPKPRKTLSGLWGGELLGGAIIKHFPFDAETAIESDEDSPLVRLCKCLNDNQSSGSPIFEGLEFYFRLLYFSEATAFYKSFNWYRPQNADKWTETPFLHEKFLQILFRCDPAYLKDYFLYQKVLEKHCGAFLDIPINNVAIENLNKGMDLTGIEPKIMGNLLQTKPIGKQSAKSVAKYIVGQPRLKYSDYLMEMLPHLEKYFP